MTHIIRCATGYTYEQLRPFIASALANTDACLDIIRYPGDSPLPYHDRLLVHEAWGEPMTCPVVQRYATIARVLCVIKGDYNVIHCDARDAVFLSDPFALTASDRIGLWATSEGKAIGTDQANYDWMRRLTYSPEIGLGLAGQPILCAGVWGGTAKAVVDHCDAITYLTAGHLWFGADQAAHNLLCRIHPTTVYNSIAHHCVLHGSEYDQGISVLHQYDRHQELVAMVNDMANGWARKAGIE